MERKVLAGPSEPVHITGMDEEVSLASSSSWEYLGEQRINTSGAQAATLPEGTTIVVLAAMSDVVRWKINGTADANSFPTSAGSVHSIGPLSNLESFGLFLSNKSVAYLQYYAVVITGSCGGGGGVRIGP